MWLPKRDVDNDHNLLYPQVIFINKYANINHHYEIKKKKKFQGHSRMYRVRKAVNTVGP